MGYLSEYSAPAIVHLNMHKSIRVTFLLLTLTQGLHSIEEYYGKLWDVFAPATFLCSLVSPDLRTGFLIINIGLFFILMLTWLATFTKNFSIRNLIWFWIIIEMINGIGHTIWALSEWSYVPGLATAPILLFLVIRMIRLLIRETNKNNAS